MNLDVHALEGGASGLATARYDRGSASMNDSESQTRIAHQFRLAMIFKIPVGYEDEKGFHHGRPRSQTAAPVFKPAEAGKDTYQF